MKVQLTKDKEVYNYCKPYIIAEIGSNHNGDMDLARKLIGQAKSCGADCIKFQSWTKDTIFSKKTYNDNYFIADDYRDRSDYTLESIVEAYSISEEELLQMKEVCDELDIDCASTPFSEQEVDFLVYKLGAPFIKTASMDLNNYPFLKYIASKGKPVVLSTGLSELYEIDKAVRTIEAEGNNQITILHCVSIYPPQDEQVNLRRIETLQKMYPNYPIGFSDHTLGYEVPLASMALGSCIIEKHFTLDKNMEGWDHKVSADQYDLKIIVNGAEKIWKSMGTNRISVQEDQERRDSFRRSIVLKRPIPAGESIKRDNVDYKRPGEGIAPEHVEWVIGRVAAVDIPDDVPLQKHFLR
ncbi:MAG: N-acetylneuraminate synthase family protein [Bacteroidota bacterium]